jgi:hypothetical protein
MSRDKNSEFSHDLILLKTLFRPFFKILKIPWTAKHLLLILQKVVNFLPLCDYGMFSGTLKGLGHEIGFKYFDKNG